MARQNKNNETKATRNYDTTAIINGATITSTDKYDRRTFAISDIIKLDHYLFDNGESAILTIDGIFNIKGAVLTANKGKNAGKKFFSFPSYKKANGQYENTAYCFDKATNDVINACLNAEG